MSLGGTYSKAMNQAVASIVELGMTVCVAAGNETVCLPLSYSLHFD